MNWNNERGGILGILILIAIIVLGIVLMNTMNGGSGSFRPSCGDNLDACKRRCGGDIKCEQECQTSYDLCIDKVPGRVVP